METNSKSAMVLRVLTSALVFLLSFPLAQSQAQVQWTYSEDIPFFHIHEWGEIQSGSDWIPFDWEKDIPGSTSGPWSFGDVTVADGEVSYYDELSCGIVTINGTYNGDQHEFTLVHTCSDDSCVSDEVYLQPWTIRAAGIFNGDRIEGTTEGSYRVFYPYKGSPCSSPPIRNVTSVWTWYGTFTVALSPVETSPQVIVWTGGEGTDGHFIPEYESWWLGEKANLPVHVAVAILHDGAQQPVERATVLLEDVPYGQTDTGGYLRFLFPICSTHPTGSFTRTVEAQWDSVSALSDEIELYRSELLESKPPLIMTSELASYYERKHLEKFVSSPGAPLWFDLLRVFAHQVFGMDYHPQVGDVVNFGAYKFTASDVQPVWLIHTRVERDGQIVLVFDAWTENEALYNGAIGNYMKYALADETITITLASPAILCVTAPDGSRAGYHPDTGGLLLDFPAAIDDPGDEPFVLLIPNPEQGEYLIQVVPDSDASPTETYSLEVTSGDTSITLASDVEIGSVPKSPYVIRVTETGITEVSVISAAVGLDPDTLNLRRPIKWVTCYIELPAGFDVHLVDGSTVELNGVPAYLGKEDWAKTEGNQWNIVDHDEDGVPERMVKFDGSLLKPVLMPGDVTVTLSGELTGGTRFEGADSIRVIDSEGTNGKEAQNSGDVLPSSEHDNSLSVGVRL